MTYMGETKVLTVSEDTSILEAAEKVRRILERESDIFWRLGEDLNRSLRAFLDLSKCNSYCETRQKVSPTHDCQRETSPLG